MPVEAPLAVKTETRWFGLGTEYIPKDGDVVKSFYENGQPKVVVRDGQETIMPRPGDSAPGLLSIDADEIERRRKLAEAEWGKKAREMIAALKAEMSKA